MSVDWHAEKEAHLRFARLLEEIDGCRKLFEGAGIPLPEMLRRMMGSTNGIDKPDMPRLHIPPPPRAQRPKEAEDDWLSVRVEEATATILVLAKLREVGVPIKAKQVVELVTDLNPKVPRGSINNIGTRLGKSLIKRTPEGWSLVDKEKAPLINDGFLWGPKDVFEKQEMAAHRREAIIHILKYFSEGLQVVQLVKRLKSCNWMHAPASKDLVKGDMELLEAHGKVCRISNSRKWKIAPNQK